jgi:hypothetical protein
LRRINKQADANLKKALLLLRSSEDEDLDKSVDLFHEALQQVDDFLIYEDYPQLFDVYLYNVASWFGRVKGKDASARKYIEHKLQECDGFEHCTLQEGARRYLVYSMARSQFVWFAVADDEDLRHIISPPEVESLKRKLTCIQKEEAKFSSNYRLAYQKGEEFKDRIDGILKEVWPR